MTPDASTTSPDAAKSRTKCTKITRAHFFELEEFAVLKRVRIQPHEQDEGQTKIVQKSSRTGRKPVGRDESVKEIMFVALRHDLAHAKKIGAMARCHRETTTPMCVVAAQ